MIAAAYLAADAAVLGDRELPALCRPPKPAPAHVIAELEYAASLFVRASRAILTELDALEGAGVDMGGFTSRDVGYNLSLLAGRAMMHAATMKEAQKNGL